jgi:hypothetical protein
MQRKRTSPQNKLLINSPRTGAQGQKADKNQAWRREKGGLGKMRNKEMDREIRKVKVANLFECVQHEHLCAGPWILKNAAVA